MTSQNEQLPPPLDGPDAALRWAEDTIKQAAQTKAALWEYVSRGEKEAPQAQSLYLNMLAQQGAAMGVIQTLFRLGMLSDSGYVTLIDKARTLQISQVAILKPPKRITILASKVPPL